MYRRQPPVDFNEIFANVHANVAQALSNINIPPIQPFQNMAWNPPCSTPGSSSSSSGRPPIPKFPKDDEVIVDVISHAIKDTFTLKRAVSVSTISGAICVDIVPSPTPSSALIRKLDTHTTSGAISCSLKTSLGPFLLDASHSTISGAIKVSYPVDWCGTVEMFLTGGSYKIRSDEDDVRVVSDIVDKSTHERRILALKGNPIEGEEWSTLKVRSKSGAIKVSFEKKPPLRDMTEEEARLEEELLRRNTSTGERDGGEGSDSRPMNKEQKERHGPAVTRAARTESASPPPPVNNLQQPERRDGEEDLPPSYEQSEADNVLNQLAGRD
ncbi:hypothetical protein ABW19_dt0210280 [Dactylella cylindrospora]|nr:hypothetical protein ABW19_dt0210280 [Dactylella cylindrospora]